MSFTKIGAGDLANKGVIGLPDTPNLPTAEIQRKFDEIALEVIVPKFNGLAGELENVNASASLGAKNTQGGNSNIQAELNTRYTKLQSDAKFVDKIPGKQLSTEDFSTAEKLKLAALYNYILPIASYQQLGGVRPDNHTITVDGNGIMRVIGAELLKQYFFQDSATIDMTTTEDAEGNKTITAGVKDGSITDNKLENNFRQDCINAKNEAIASATAAEESSDTALDTLEEIKRVTSIPSFTIDFVTGEVIYNREAEYVFEINNTTGNLEWEVVA